MKDNFKVNVKSKLQTTLLSENVNRKYIGSSKSSIRRGIRQLVEYNFHNISRFFSLTYIYTDTRKQKNSHIYKTLTATIQGQRIVKKLVRIDQWRT